MTWQNFARHEGTQNMTWSSAMLNWQMKTDTMTGWWESRHLGLMKMGNRWKWAELEQRSRTEETQLRTEYTNLTEDNQKHICTTFGFYMFYCIQCYYLNDLFKWWSSGVQPFTAYFRLRIKYIFLYNILFFFL